MLSNALRVGHRPINKRKAREKRAEAEAPRQAPAPVQPAGVVEQRPANWRQTALGLGAVGAHGAALLPFLQFYLRAIPDWLLSGQVSYQNSYYIWFAPSTQAMDAGIMLSLLLSGWLFFKHQQRLPMLTNALLWIVLFNALPDVSDRASWPCIVAALASLATAFALGKHGPQEPETPVE